jgi:hypothetical protein
LPEDALAAARAFTAVFGDPRPLHPLLVYCQLCERSILVAVAAVIGRAAADVRGTEVAAEQSSGGGSGGGGGGGCWWASLVPRRFADVRLVSLSPEELRAGVPNRCAALAASLLALWHEGLPGATGAADATAGHTQQHPASTAPLAPLSLATAVLAPMSETGGVDGSGGTGGAGGPSPSPSSTASAWLEGKSDEDALWFSAQCEANLRSLRATLACVAPTPSAAAVGDATGAGRHRSMNAVARCVSAVARDALRGVATAWRRLGPMLRGGALSRVEMEWVTRTGSAAPRAAAAAAAAKATRPADAGWGTLSGTGAAAAMAGADAGGDGDGDAAAVDDAGGETLDDSARTASMMRRLLPAIAAFSFSVPQRTLDALRFADGDAPGGSGAGSGPAADLHVAAVRLEMAGWLRIIGKLVAALLRELLLADIAGFFCAMAALSFDVGASSAGPTAAAASGATRRGASDGRAGADDDGASRDGGGGRGSAAGTVGFDAAAKHRAIEAELAATVRRWSAVVSGAARDVAELQRALALECDLRSPQASGPSAAQQQRPGGVGSGARVVASGAASSLLDPLSDDVVQRHVLRPLARHFTEALRRLYCVAMHERAAPKSAAWVLREMAVAAQALHHEGSGGRQQQGTRPAAAAGAAAVAGAGAGTTGSAQSRGRVDAAPATVASFAETMEVFVAQARQSMTARFGDAAATTALGTTPATRPVAAGGGGVAGAPAVTSPICTDFSLAAVQAASQLLVVCAPLLRVVRRFEPTLCRLVAGCVVDAVGVLRERAAIVLVQRTSSDCVDADCASWLSFLSAAPFAGCHAVREAVGLAFASAPSAAILGGSASVGGGGAARDTGAAGGGGGGDAGASGAGGGPQAGGDATVAFLTSRIAHQLLGYLRCTVAEAAVADAFAIVHCAAPAVIADNVAATLTLRSTAVDDAATPWTMKVLRESPAAVDALLAQARASFLPLLASLPAVADEVYEAARAGIERVAAKATVASLDSWFVHVARSTYNIDVAVSPLAPPSGVAGAVSTASAADSLWAQGAAADGASSSAFLVLGDRGVRSGAGDVVSALCENLLCGLRWRARVLQPLLRAVSVGADLVPPAIAATAAGAAGATGLAAGMVRTTSGGGGEPGGGYTLAVVAASQPAVWDAVAGTAVQWLAQRHALLAASWCNRRASAAVRWQQRCFAGVCTELSHVLARRLDDGCLSAMALGSAAGSGPSAASTAAASAAVISSLRERRDTWLAALRAMIASATGDDAGDDRCGAAAASAALSAAAPPPQHEAWFAGREFAAIDRWATGAAEDPRAAAQFVAVEVLDAYLSRDAPTEHAAWLRERSGVDVAAGVAGAAPPGGHGARGGAARGGPAFAAAHGESWWAADARGAERREAKLLASRTARAAAASSLLSVASMSAAASSAAAAAPSRLRSGGDESEDDRPAAAAAGAGGLRPRRAGGRAGRGGAGAGASRAARHAQHAQPAPQAGGGSVSAPPPRMPSTEAPHSRTDSGSGAAPAAASAPAAAAPEPAAAPAPARQGFERRRRHA